MKQLNDLFHVADFMREEFDNGLVAAHFAQMAKNVEESVDFVRDIVGLSCNSLANIDLQEFHDRRHECIQDRVQNAWLLLVFLKDGIDAGSEDAALMIVWDAQFSNSLWFFYRCGRGIFENLPRDKINVLWFGGKLKQIRNVAKQSCLFLDECLKDLLLKVLIMLIDLHGVCALSILLQWFHNFVLQSEERILKGVNNLLCHYLIFVLSI